MSLKKKNTFGGREDEKQNKSIVKKKMKKNSPGRWLQCAYNA